jgi:hypothetical protein
MKKLFFSLLLMPLIGLGQAKTVLNASRYFCKTDKVQEFERGLAAHAQKYHKGDWKWRVWTIESGPDAGGYMITEGPSDWATIDGRGDISAEHKADWEKNVSPYTTERYSTMYLSFESDMSTVKLEDYADKILINHAMAKPGKILAVKDLVNRLKKVWTAGNESVAVYSTIGSGSPSYITVSRLKTGFKELADGFRKPMPERYDAAYTAGAWDTYLKDYADAVESRWSELLVYQPKLSSK